MDTQQHRTQILKRRGVALVTTLAGMVVITMLVVAFLATQRSQLALTGNSLERKACREAARSLAEYCRYQLEELESWGRLSGDELLEPVQLRDPAGVVLLTLQPLSRDQARAKPEFAGLTGDAYFEAALPEDGVRVAGTVSNNLSNKSAHLTEPVGPKACLLRIRAYRGDTSETVEVMLRRAAFFDSTIATSGQIDIDARAVEFASADRLRNQIRSKSDILLPDYPDIEFTPHDGSQASEKGTVWAGGDIAIGGDASEAKLLLAADQTGGEFLADAPTFYEVPELRLTDLAPREERDRTELEPGHYLFTELGVEFLDTDGIRHEQDITVLAVMADRDMLEFHFCEKDLSIEDEDEDEGPPAPEPSPLPSASPTPVGPTPVPSTVKCRGLAGTPQGDHKFFLGGFEMTLGSKGSGAFGLGAEEDYWVEGSLTLAGGNPELASSLVFTDHYPDPDRPEEGSLSVSGDLVVGASVVNCGRLLAGQDVLLSPYDVEIDKKEEGNDIAVFAGRDVTIRPMFRAEEAFQSGPGRVFVFRGIVYAERDFSFLSAFGQRDQDVYNRRLYLEGAVVARQGEVLIRGKERVQIKYNREFLDDLLEKSVESDMVQLEELSMRSL